MYASDSDRLKAVKLFTMGRISLVSLSFVVKGLLLICEGQAWLKLASCRYIMDLFGA